METQRYKLLIAYDGFEYAGWQVQPDMKTVQGELEKCFHRLTGENIKVHGSGRTDQGVHAVGQVAHADLPGHLPNGKIIQAVNSLLPPDIRLLKVTAVKANFHARRDAANKEYRYFIWNGAVLPPFPVHYRTHIRSPLNVLEMQKSATLLTGKHDFAAFTANPKRIVESTVRDLSRLAVRRRGNDIIIAARGDGFLYRMVRSLAGLLIRVGMGDLPSAEAKKILARKERTAVVPTAPPQGLFLWRVYYD
ncbi:MAG: tRNA pseudouridine(38-40) synthase TruA [Kiritimatiellia bacterium]|nr:tRNA pseudouridine(38-40) synthase TruA [Kiritimatiellia bacterium]